MGQAIVPVYASDIATVVVASVEGVKLTIVGLRVDELPLF
jgi:hypothetical protein